MWVEIHVCGCGVGGDTCVCVGTIAIIDFSISIKELQISLFTLEIIQSQQELEAIKASPSKQPISEISVSSPPHSQDCTWSSPPAHGTRPAA